MNRIHYRRRKDGTAMVWAFTEVNGQVKALLTPSYTVEETAERRKPLVKAAVDDLFAQEAEKHSAAHERRKEAQDGRQ